MRIGGVVGWLQSNLIALAGVILLSSMFIGSMTYVFGGEKTARFFLGAAYLAGSGNAVLSETPEEYTQGYRDMKVVAQAQVYNPADRSWTTVNPKQPKAKP